MAAIHQSCLECIYQRTCEFNEYGINGDNCIHRLDFDEIVPDDDSEAD